MSGPTHERLHPATSLVRLPLSAAPWLAAGYLASYPLVGGALFAVATAAFVAGVVLSQFTVTVPVIICSVWVIRGCAALVDRPIPYRYREVTEPGLPRLPHAPPVVPGHRRLRQRRR